MKARLVARGFEEDSTQLTKDSPTCSRESLRLLFAAAATNKWNIQSIDISSAFLQGNELERDVYLIPPKDIRKPGVIWKLNRCIYGLNDAPRAWYNRVSAEMRSLGAKVSKYDKSLFTWHVDKELQGMLVCHVDDFAFAGTATWEESVIKPLIARFKISCQSTSSFKYLGLSVRQSSSEIEVDQHAYTEQIQPISLKQERRKELHEPIDKKERDELRSLAGKMLWVTGQTRPDLAFETCSMSNVGKNPTVKKILEANKAVAKIKSRKL